MKGWLRSSPPASFGRLRLHGSPALRQRRHFSCCNFKPARAHALSHTPRRRDAKVNEGTNRNFIQQIYEKVNQGFSNNQNDGEWATSHGACCQQDRQSRASRSPSFQPAHKVNAKGTQRGTLPTNYPPAGKSGFSSRGPL
eukprot:GHVT01073029.1.p1 GENE.GHVT01073029.1~~GHVT01073029.1.p1  ORF type:complete len:140 (-),score=24.67 GHVT01073029.1:873-1292(-)